VSDAASLGSGSDRRKGPGFLCVGPERTGTSWLYTHLRRHPDVYLTQAKELRYFHEAQAYGSEGWGARFLKRGDWHNRAYRSYLADRLSAYMRRPKQVRNWERVKWDLNYLLSPRNDSWYLSLFDGCRADALAGDISPQYFSLPECGVAHIASLLPKAKIVIGLRDPVEWLWSFARMALLDGRSASAVSSRQFVDFFERYAHCFPTVARIDLWRRYFPDSQIHFCFFDAIRDDPQRALAEVANFIGVDPQRTPFGRMTLSAAVNPGPPLALPKELAVGLSKRWRDEIEALCLRFGSYPIRWREACDRTLSELA
jgi:hypothetical protein